MKISTSYFYQIRNFKENMIPVSTAILDPKWFHDFKDNSYFFKDRNNIWNGIRSSYLFPDGECDSLCKGQKDGVCIAGNIEADPMNCEFLKAYRRKLDNVGFEKIYSELEQIANKVKEINKIDDPHIVLMVYEDPNNNCSERRVLHEFFKEHGVEVEELEYPIV